MIRVLGVRHLKPRPCHGLFLYFDVLYENFIIEFVPHSLFAVRINFADAQYLYRVNLAIRGGKLAFMASPKPFEPDIIGQGVGVAILFKVLYQF